jgi:hypothetical protein
VKSKWEESGYTSQGVNVGGNNIEGQKDNGRKRQWTGDIEYVCTWETKGKLDTVLRKLNVKIREVNEGNRNTMKWRITNSNITRVKPRPTYVCNCWYNAHWTSLPHTRNKTALQKKLLFDTSRLHEYFHFHF